jgi:hypothetical protein
MNKNNKPYSEPKDLKIAFASSFLFFAYAKNKYIGQIKKETDWNTIPIVPGSLQTSCTLNDTDSYDIQITFRVSFAEPENQSYILQFLNLPLIARYVSASEQTKIAGTVENFLLLSINTPAGFDGYECTLKGTQKTPELFLQ